MVHVPGWLQLRVRVTLQGGGQEGVRQAQACQGWVKMQGWRLEAEAGGLGRPRQARSGE